MAIPPEITKAIQAYASTQHEYPKQLILGYWTYSALRLEVASSVNYTIKDIELQSFESIPIVVDPEIPERATATAGQPHIVMEQMNNEPTTP